MLRRGYADLIRGLYDLYRFELYKSLHFPLPKKSGNYEVASGKALPSFWRGTVEIKYLTDKEPV